MANLLPSDLKKEIRTEYLYRLLVVLSVHLVFGGLVVVSFALSGLFEVRGNYFLVKAQSDKASAAELTAADKALLEDFDKFRIQLDALSVPEKNFPTFTDMVRVVLVGKGNNVRLSSFSIAEDVSKNPTLVISGVAATRDALLSFQKYLTDNESFTAVDLPVSNFSKRADIEFTITLTIAKP